MKNDIKLSTIGYADIDYDKFIEWYDSDAAFKWCDGRWSNTFYKLQGEGVKHNIYDQICGIVYNSEDSRLSMDEDRRAQLKYDFGICREKYKDFLSKRLKYCREFEQRIPVVFKNEEIYLVQFGDLECCIPVDANCLKFKPLKDYSNQQYINLKNIKNLTGDNSGNIDNGLIEQDLSLISMQQTMCKFKEFEDKFDTYKSDIKNGKVKELEALQKELDDKMTALNKKKEEMLAELESRKEQMELMKQQMEQKLFLLETEIYAIRCYLGEVVDFIKLRKGKNASICQPLVMLQKVRYLDEEMGKLGALYNFSIDDLEYFEQVIRDNDIVMNNFLPAQKCICLVRLSKTGLRLGRSETFANMLDLYRDEHGKKIGILIRDGENIYMCWTDEEKISIKEDMFYRPSIKTYEQEDEYLADKAESSPYEVASRYFLFNILLGASSGEYNEPILTLNPKANLYVPSEYVIYSTADAWIEDNRFGTLSDIVNKINEHTKVGDSIITCQHLYPENYSGHRANGAWENARGRGDRNITHDVSASDGAIYKINCIDYEGSTLKIVTDQIETKRYTKWVAGQLKETFREEVLDIDFWYTNKDTDETIEAKLARWLDNRGLTYDNIAERELRKYKKTYISLSKCNMDYVYNGGRYTERQRESRANFRIDEDEYVNVELMNSEWIKYILTTRKIGDRFGSNRHMDFNYVVFYLNKMLKEVVEREKEEYKLISQHVDLTKYPEWMVALSEWKVETGHHIIGPRYAKQFAKTLS